jgi:hypothetical protein
MRRRLSRYWLKSTIALKKVVYRKNYKKLTILILKKNYVMQIQDLKDFA